MQPIGFETPTGGDQSGCLREGWGGDIAINFDRTAVGYVI